MAYTPTAWVDDSLPAISAANLNHLESGVQSAAAVADAALPTPAGSNGQFLKKVGGVWVPTSFAASDIPSYPTDATKALLGDGSWAALKNAQIDAAAAIAVTKLAAGSEGQVLSMLAGAVQWGGGAVLLNDSALSATAANIDFTSISGAYKHLLGIVYGSSDQAASQASNLVINNDTGTNYDYQNLLANASTASASESFAQTAMLLGNVGTTTAGTVGGQVFFIPNYAATALNKVILVIGGNKTGTASGSLSFRALAGWWRSVSAITRLTWKPGSGNLASGARFSLYGIG